ncbi:MAG: hypothetical protein AAFY76_02490 [Cyanobacteria bacterium J06649_11]
MVKELVDDLVTSVCSSAPEESETTTQKPASNRRGQNRREQHSAIRKAQVIHDYEAGIGQDVIAAKYKINRSLVSKWNANKKKILECAASEYRKHLKIRPARKYNDLYKELLDEFKTARSKGHRVNFGWLWSKARIIYRRQKNDPNVTVRKHVITAFIKRNRVRMRTRQRNRRESKEAYRNDLMKWHGTTRERLVKTGKDDQYDPKWGRFVPKQRFNVDQSPLPFAVETKRTYEIIEKKQSKNHKVWISQPGSGLDKRQCTLQVCFRPTGEQPRIAVIFRGKGKLGDDEKKAWHQDVDVYFQQNAWADTEFSLKWVEKTLSPVVKNESRYALFCDNLTAQASDDFKKSVAETSSGIVWYGLPNATDLWQPVDAGYAELLKCFVNQEHTTWLDDEANADKWYGGKFTAKERRILITHWVGNAYQKLIGPAYDNFRWRMFQKTGCLITANGEEDNLIQPEGLENYKVPPPVEFIEPLSTNPEQPTAATIEEEPNDVQVIDDVEEVQDDEIEVESIPDNVEDRSEDDELIGRELKALYENGWYKGEIRYFNSRIGKYKVRFSDGDEDFVGIEEIDGVEIVLL